MSEPILRLSNVESAYGPITAIRGVSLEVPRGKIVAVLGANGAGKTTILKTTSGVLDPVTGVVELEGRASRAWPDAIVALGMSHVPEGREVSVPVGARQSVDGPICVATRTASPPTWKRSTTIFPCCASGATSRLASCLAVSSRCSPSRAP